MSRIGITSGDDAEMMSNLGPHLELPDGMFPSDFAAILDEVIAPAPVRQVQQVQPVRRPVQQVQQVRPVPQAWPPVPQAWPPVQPVRRSMNRVQFVHPSGEPVPPSLETDKNLMAVLAQGFGANLGFDMSDIDEFKESLGLMCSTTATSQEAQPMTGIVSPSATTRIVVGI